MSRERWDVVLRFLDGPLAARGEVVAGGPVIRLGASPGAGGLRLEGYRGLDDRQAVITTYDGEPVIAPVGTAQVRLAAHEHVDWNELQPLRGPAHLTGGCAFHLGPVGRGATVRFVDCQPLGVWKQQRILSEANAAEPEAAPSEVRELSAARGVPPWFVGGVVVIAMAVAVAVVLPLVKAYQRHARPLGPMLSERDHFDEIPLDMEVNSKLLDGLDQGFQVFVMRDNARAARWKALERDKSLWDERLLEFVTRSMELHLQQWPFWERLDAIVDDYAEVVTELRKAGLPEVLAAIPYQESRYRAGEQSPVCAKGPWQFMPEVAHRLGLEVRGCRFRGTSITWSPTRDIPPLHVSRRAPYVDENGRCRIPADGGCEVDERTDMRKATMAAVETLGEAWKDPDIDASGAAVQLTIASHDAGYDDSRFRANGRKNLYNVLPAYQRWLQTTGQDRDAGFFGKQIRCALGTKGQEGSCDSMLPPEAQHYVPHVIAQHLLAVCFYGQNYGGRPEFRSWARYGASGGYCRTIQVPSLDQLDARRR